MGVAKGKTRPRLSLSTVQRYDIKNWPRPYLSVFVRLCEKKFIFLDFSCFQAPEIRQNPCKTAEKWLSLQCSKQLCKSEDVKLLRLWRCRYSSSCVESHALSMSTLASYAQISITSYHLSHPPLASKINDHQNLSKIAPCTPIFTKFEPRIGKSTTPQMDKWRPKTMRRAPKSRLFRPSARPFFHQKRGRIALWIHWRTLQLIEYHYFNWLRLSSCRLVILSKSKWKSSQNF